VLTVVRVSTFIDQAKRNVKSGMGRSMEAPDHRLHRLCSACGPACSSAATRASMFSSWIAFASNVADWLQSRRPLILLPIGNKAGIMVERYTEKARRVIFFARYEASQFGSPCIETEHLLLGLLREDKALANRFLRSSASVESIRKQIEAHTTLREKVSTSVARREVLRRGHPA
jgi:hypothetical protein